MANTENIEAKLCAYVDGELDAAGRAEIEQHLATNPQHRVLMAELTAQRQTLRELPRAKAPDDLLESVQNQLERSVLLEQAGDDEKPAVAGRIERWPQILSAAAVLFLVLGLGAVMMYVLTPPARRQGSIAMKPASAPAATPAPPSFGESADRGGATTAPTGDLTVALRERDKDAALEMKSPAAAADSLAGAAARKSDASKSEASDIAPPPVPAATPAPAPVAAIPPPPAPAAQPAQPTDVFTKGGDSRVGGGGTGGYDYKNVFANAGEQLKNKDLPDNSLYMVVSSDDPSAADRQVRKYLDSNSIRWDAVAQQAPPPIQESQALSGSRLQSVQMKLKTADDIAGAKKEQEKSALDDQTAAQQQQQRQLQTLAPRKEAAAAEAAPVQQQQSSQQPGQGLRQSPAPVRVAKGAGPSQSERFAEKGAATTRPTDASQVAQRAFDDLEKVNTKSPGAALDGVTTNAATDEGAMAQQQQAQQQQQVQQQAGSRPPQLIIARGLTHEQVKDLTTCLQVQNGGRVENYRRSGDNYAPTTLPALAAGASGGLPSSSGSGSTTTGTIAQVRNGTDNRGAFTLNAQPAPLNRVGGGATTTLAAPSTSPALPPGVLVEGPRTVPSATTSMMTNSATPSPVAEALDNERRIRQQASAAASLATAPATAPAGAFALTPPPAPAAPTTQPAVQEAEQQAQALPADRQDVVIVVQPDSAGTGAAADQIQQQVQEPEKRSAPASQP